MLFIRTGAYNTPTVGNQTIIKSRPTPKFHNMPHEVIKFHPLEALSPDSSSRSIIPLALHCSCGGASFKIISIIASVGTHLFAAKRHKATSRGVSEISGMIHLSRSPWSSTVPVTSVSGQLGGKVALMVEPPWPNSLSSRDTCI